MSEPLDVKVKVADLPAFKTFVERVQEFVSEYAWHHLSCASIDGDGEWRRGNAPCSCGYDEALAAMTDAAPEQTLPAPVLPEETP